LVYEVVSTNIAAKMNQTSQINISVINLWRWCD